MPVTGPEPVLGVLRALLLLGLAWPAAAQSAPADRERAARDLIANAAGSLAGRDAAGFLAAFAPSLADQLRKPIEALARDYEIQPALQFVNASAENNGIAFTIDWNMSLTAREGQRGVTHRHEVVSCSVELHGGLPRIAALEGKNAPDAAAFFSPPDVGGAWDLLQGAARALSQPDSPAAGFLAAFDSRMPGYEALRIGAQDLAARGEVDSTIGLTSDEGTDTVRTIEADWTLEVVDSGTRIRILQHEAPLVFTIERRGKRWVIVSLRPPDFFRP